MENESVIGLDMVAANAITATKRNHPGEQEDRPAAERSGAESVQQGRHHKPLGGGRNAQ